MSTKLSRFATALHRLIPWHATQTLMPDLPSELIFQEILPYIHEDSPASLAGLQVALTCKAFYHYLHPYISRFLVDQLVEAYPKHATLGVSLIAQPTGGPPKMDIQEFERKAEAAFELSTLDFLGDSTPREPLDGFDSPFRLTYYVHLGSFDDIDLLWALISLLSKPHVSRFMYKLEIGLADNGAVRGYTEGGHLVNASDRWKRAFAKLVNIATEKEGVKLRLGTVQSVVRGPEETLGSPPSTSTLFSKSRLSKLDLSGRVLDLFWHQHLNSLVTQSSQTLTHLRISCFDTPQARWQVVLSHWHLPMLETFEIENTDIPLTTLTPFLLLNPYIRSATIFIPPKAIPPGTRLPIRPEDYPRFLPRLKNLTATTDVLLALFTPWPTASHRDIPLYNLENLTVIKETAPRSSPVPKLDANYDDINRVLLYAPGSKEPGKQSRISLQSITIELPYEIVVVERWLESASPIGQCPTERQPDGLILSTMKSAVRVASGLVMSTPAPPPELATSLASLTQISSFGLKIRDQDQLDILLDGARPGFSFNPYTVADFMAGLPAVKEVVLDGLFGCPQMAVRDADEFWGAIRSMREQCGSLETLEIRGLGGSTTPVVWSIEDDEPTPGFAAWAHVFDDGDE